MPKIIKGSINRKRRSLRVGSRSARKCKMYTLRASDFNDFHTLEELADSYLDSRIQVAGEHNLLTFNDNYISNLRKFAR